MKFIYIILSVLLLGTVSRSVSAKSLSEKGNGHFYLPKEATEVAPNIYYLGKSKDVDGKEVEGFAFTRRKDERVKPSKSLKGPSCYGFLANGAKWKVVEPWIVNPANAYLDGSFVLSNLASDIGKWESAASRNVLGKGSATSSLLVADTTAPDGNNEVYFAGIADPGVIAVTVVWGNFGGPVQNRKLVEWDQVYDDEDYPWSDSGESGKMDFENIATHELGHSVGMNDIYLSGCFEVTMYGYADYGEINKRTLETPDIIGVRELYK